MGKTRIVRLAILLVIVFYCAGCGDKFYDPTQIGRFRPVPAVNVILDSLGVAEEAPSPFDSAEKPRPADVIAYDTDYYFGPGDVIRISIFELLQEGRYVVNDFVVTETGKISIPEVGIVEVTGLTESQLEDEIKQILAPSILKEPSVTVSLLSSETRTFSISGNGIPRPSRYSIPRTDFRLLEALAVAGGVSQFNSSYIYVVREVTGKEAIAQPAVEPAAAEPRQEKLELSPEEEMLEIIAPRADRGWLGTGGAVVVNASEMVTDKELAEAAVPEGLEAEDDTETPATEPILSRRETIEEPIDQSSTGRIEWIFQDGKWVPVQVGSGPKESAVRTEPQQRIEELQEKAPDSFDWGDIGTGGVATRVIEVPADKLRGGDPRYNVIIRPGDSVQVPLDIIGEFGIMGNINAQGFINLTGRPMTLKMAIAAAGGLGPLAWPKSCEVVRRIAKKKEEIVMVNLDKIASGEQPDFFIKPNDLINVGTHPTARWRAVLRNAFRATYGFGFIYDRNFADRDFGTSRPIPNWF